MRSLPSSVRPTTTGHAGVASVSAGRNIDEPLVELRILGLPVALAATTAAGLDELLREFLHLREDSGSVPSRLVALRDEITGRFGTYTAAARDRMLEAQRDEVGTVDLTYLVPQEAVDAAAAIDALLDEADAFCAEGDLLTMALPPRLVTFRPWYLGEFVRHSRGEAPVRWAGPIR